MKLIAKTNEIEGRKTEKIVETKSWFLQRSDTKDNCVVKVVKHETQVNNVKDERGDITTGFTGSKRFMKEYYKQLYTN